MNDDLRDHVRVMADWLDMAADVISQDRGAVLIVDQALRAADRGRALADVESGQVAASAREATELRLERK